MSTRALLAILLAVATAGCGFQLRGDYDLPPAMERVVLTGPERLRDEVLVGLRASDVEVVDNRAEATAVIALGREHFSRRVLTVSPDTGKASEYEVGYTVTFQVTAPDGRALAPSQAVRLVRDYVFDPDAVIGKSRELGVLYDEMRRDAAQQILLRLQRLDAA